MTRKSKPPLRIVEDDPVQRALVRKDRAIEGICADMLRRTGLGQ